MDTNEVIEKTNEIEEEKIELRNKIKKINAIYSSIVSNCPHELVFKFNDNHPRKMVIDGNYYCPACGKIIECIAKYQYSETEFRNSKIIDLYNLSLVANAKTLTKIREEVINNKDFYYNCRDLVEVKNRMEDKLYDYQSSYKKERKELLKRLKHN